MLVSSSQNTLPHHLKDKINRLEGIEHRSSHTAPICDIIDKSLPYNGLPLGCVHEIKGSGLASAIAFASLLSNQISQAGPVLYVAPDRSFYPLGVLPCGVKLDRWIHVSARRSKDLAWTVLEALRCRQVKAVLAVMTAANLTYCRRLQLAAENSGATGFLINRETASFSIASAITRWQVSSMKAPAGGSLNQAFWKLELLYCRGGRPGKWMVTWRDSYPAGLECISELSARPGQRVLPLSETALAG